MDFTNFTELIILQLGWMQRVGMRRDISVWWTLESDDAESLMVLYRHLAAIIYKCKSVSMWLFCYSLHFFHVSIAII